MHSGIYARSCSYRLELINVRAFTPFTHTLLDAIGEVPANCEVSWADKKEIDAFVAASSMMAPCLWLVVFVVLLPSGEMLNGTCRRRST